MKLSKVNSKILLEIMKNAEVANIVLFRTMMALAMFLMSNGLSITIPQKLGIDV